MADSKQPNSDRDDATLSPSRSRQLNDDGVEPRASLVGLLGPLAGQRFPLADKALLGRRQDVDIPLAVRDVSRLHARITLTEGGGYLLEDLGSTHGTFVNGAPVNRQLLRYGDTVQLGYAASFVFSATQERPAERIATRELGSVTQLAGGVAHHFNNLMAVVQSNLAYLGSLPQDARLNDATVEESLADIRQAAEQASRITRQLLGFARLGKYENRTVDLSTLARELVDGVEQRAPGVRVHSEIGPGLLVRGDAGQLGEALSSLVDNAEEAMRGTGELWLVAKRHTRSTPQSDIQLRFTPAVVVTIRDNGPGMNEETRSHAFEPFFSTKTPAGGTGLGLAAVFGIIKNHGGEIQMDSAPGKGTTFNIQLPVEGSLRHPRATVEAASPPAQTALVAISDRDRREALVTILERLGQQSVVALDGRAAIVQFLEQRERISLAIVSRDLAGLGGSDTARMLRRIQPRLPVLLSGQPTGDEQALLQQASAQGLLTEPFNLQNVRAALRSLVPAPVDDEDQTTAVDLQRVPTRVGDRDPI